MPLLEVTGLSAVGDRGLTAVDAVDLTVLLEEQTGAKVDPKSFVDMKTLGDLHKMVERVVAGKAG